MTKNKPVILHVGYGKTGSSALQSSLALSSEALAQAGIFYPPSVSDARAMRGEVSSGNVALPMLEDRYQRAAQARSKAETILFSNEGLFHRLIMNPDPLRAILAQGAEVRVVLYIRNPVKHAVSAYGQAIKRNGLVTDFDTYLSTYKIPNMVVKFLRLMRDLGVDVTVLNYSRHQRHLLSSFADALGINAALLQVPPVANVNRSLTPSEMFLLQCFNREWGKDASHSLSAALCNNLPDQPAEGVPKLTRAGYDTFCERMVPILKRVNKHIPAAEVLAVEPYEEVFGGNGDRDDWLRFSENQMRVIVGSIADHPPSENVAETFAELVRRLTPGKTLSAGDLAVMTELASRLRRVKP